VSVHKLVLLPENPHTHLDNTGELAACLQAIGFIGEPNRCSHGIFYPTGADFLQLVSFLGCSPMIELEPPTDAALLDAACADASFCHIRLVHSDILQFRADAQTRPPRCPQCSQPQPDWRDPIDHWNNDPRQIAWSCASCDFCGELTALKFRRTAGFGKLFVEIRGIYPSEAVPVDTLLAALASLTRDAWQYIYIKE